ncbi:MAG: molybdopterin synthase catalytic subunit [Nitrososphaeria archaeon]
MLVPGIYPKGSVDLYKILDEILKSIEDKSVGAIVTFVGVSKDVSTVSEKRVKNVSIESYKQEADKVVQRICDEIKRDFSLSYITIIHLEGEFNPGEPIVGVVVASKSREQAFQAMMRAIERYKKEPPIFKKENYFDGLSEWLS